MNSRRRIRHLPGRHGGSLSRPRMHGNGPSEAKGGVRPAFAPGLDAGSIGSPRPWESHWDSFGSPAGSRQHPKRTTGAPTSLARHPAGSGHSRRPLGLNAPRDFRRVGMSRLWSPRRAVAHVAVPMRRPSGSEGRRWAACANRLWAGLARDCQPRPRAPAPPSHSVAAGGRWPRWRRLRPRWVGGTYDEPADAPKLMRAPGPLLVSGKAPCFPHRSSATAPPRRGKVYDCLSLTLPGGSLLGTD